MDTAADTKGVGSHRGPHCLRFFFCAQEAQSSGPADQLGIEGLKGVLSAWQAVSHSGFFLPSSG